MSLFRSIVAAALLSFVAPLACPAAEADPLGVYTGRARIDAYSQARKFALTPAKASKGAEFANAHWLKGAVGEAMIYCQIPVPAGQWQEIEFSFTPAASGNVVLELKGEYSKIADAWVYYDLVTVKGAKLVNGDFEQGGETATGWRFMRLGGAEVISDATGARSGKRFIKVCHDVLAAQTLEVAKGQPVTVTAWARALADAKPIAQAKLIPGRQWERSIRRFELSDRLQPVKPGMIVFVGSSSMRGWGTLKRDMAPLEVVNRGFGGSTMADVLQYMDRIVLKYKPRAVVVYEGDNDSAKSLTTEQFMAQCKTFVKRLHAAQPDTPVYFLSVKPSPRRWKIWPLAVEYNAALKAWCDKTDGLTYIDIAGPMLGEDGKPRTELFLADELHMKPAGYKLWTGIVRPVLPKNLKKD